MVPIEICPDIVLAKPHLRIQVVLGLHLRRSRFLARRRRAQNLPSCSCNIKQALKHSPKETTESTHIETLAEGYIYIYIYIYLSIIKRDTTPIYIYNGLFFFAFLFGSFLIRLLLSCRIFGGWRPPNPRNRLGGLRPPDAPNVGLMAAIKSQKVAT